MKAKGQGRIVNVERELETCFGRVGRTTFRTNIAAEIDMEFHDAQRLMSQGGCFEFEVELQETDAEKIVRLEGEVEKLQRRVKRLESA